MDRLKNRKENDLKRITFEQRIAKMKNDGTYLKLRQIEKLKGKIKENPGDPEKWMSVQNYRHFSSQLYSDSHMKIMDQGENLNKLRQNIRKQNREPNEIEINQFASYNLGLYEKALKMM